MLRVGIGFAGHPEPIVVSGVNSDEGAEQPVPDREDDTEVVLCGRGNVVPAVEAWRDEDGFDPTNPCPEVAVVRDAVDRGDRDRRSDDRCRDADGE
jgi:hypothetical protein